MLLAFQYQLYNPQSIQNRFWDFLSSQQQPQKSFVLLVKGIKITWSSKVLPALLQPWKI